MTNANPKLQHMVGFSQADDSTDTETTETTDDNQFFDERSEIHEVYWIACDANRRNGPQILNNEHLSVKGTDSGVSGVVDDYRFFDEQKSDLIEEITGELDMYGLRKYREDFEEPDEDMWVEAGSDHYGINIVGVHKIPEEQAREEFDVDYSQDGIDPIFVPIIENPETGEEEVYEPLDFYEGKAPEAVQQSEPEGTEDTDTSEGAGKPAGEADAPVDEEVAEQPSTAVEEPDLPADADTVMEWLEQRDYDSLNKQERATLHKLRDPTVSNRDIAKRDDVDCSKNTVRKGLIKHLGEEGYEAIKERASDLRTEAAKEETENGGGDDYEEKMMATTSGDAETESADEDAETLDVDRDDFQNMVATLNQQAETIETLTTKVNSLEERVEGAESGLTVLADNLVETGNELHR